MTPSDPFYNQPTQLRAGVRMAKKRRGMIIKNTDDRPVEIQMATRDIRVNPGQEVMITAEEVRDSALRQNLQIRAISIVRPVTEEEEEELMRSQMDPSTEA